MQAIYPTYFEKLKLLNPNLSPKTARNHRQIIANFLKSIEKPVNQITYGEIEDFILHRSRTISPGWRNIILSVLDSWLNFLADRNEIDQSIADKFTVLKKKAYTFNVSRQIQKPPFESADLKKLLQTVQMRRCNPDRRDQDLAVLGCILFLGLRLGEVLNIETSEVTIREDYRKFYHDDDPEKGRNYARESAENIFSAVIEIPWGKIKWHAPDEPGAYRNVFWEVSELAGINFYRLFRSRYEKAVSAGKRFLFHNLRNSPPSEIINLQSPISNLQSPRSGEKINLSYYEKNFPRWIRRADLIQHYTTHQLRHTFASWNYGNPNIPAHIMQDLLGHKKIVDQFGQQLNGATAVYHKAEKPDDIDIYYFHAQSWIARRN